VLLLGIAYKKDIADVRESPALDIMKILQQKGANVIYNDPYVPELALDDGKKSKSVELNSKLLISADCVAIISDHSKYNFQWIVDKARVVVDTRNATKFVKNGREKIFKI